MTSPQSPPNRRRRRIVATIAVLVLGLGWWFWPRSIDARLIGTWTDGNETMSVSRNGLLDQFCWTIVKPATEWRGRSTESGANVGPLCLETSGDQFKVIIRRRPSSVADALRIIADSLEGQAVSVVCQTGRIVDGNATRLVLSIDGHGVCRYERVPSQ